MSEGRRGWEKVIESEADSLLSEETCGARSHSAEIIILTEIKNLFFNEGNGNIILSYLYIFESFMKPVF